VREVFAAESGGVELVAVGASSHLVEALVASHLVGGGDGVLVGVGHLEPHSD